MAFTLAPLFIWGAYGMTVANNIVFGYNARDSSGVNAGVPNCTAGAHVVGTGAGGTTDKIYLADNCWGGAVSSLSSTNSCQYGVYFDGTFGSATAVDERDNGLGLGGGSLVVGGDSSVHLVTTFLNSWANVGGGNNAAGYWKDGDGAVHLQGVIGAGSLAASAFGLPQGFRPAGICNFIVMCNSAPGYVTVDSGGNVTPQSGGNAWLSLEGIVFRAA